LNVEFAEHGLEPIQIASPGRSLVEEDYLEMVSAGIFDYTICDQYFAEIRAEVLDGLVVRDDIPARVGGSLAWAIRKHSPGLQARLDEFVRDNKKGTMMGNVLFKRYFAQTKWVKNPITDVGEEVFGKLRAPIQKYSEQYGFDWRLMAAQAYQESHLDPNARSYSGAIGLMQLLPATAKDMGFDDVTGIDDNLHAGIKYMAWLRDNYFSDETVPEASRVDFALAAYNAGIGRVRRWRREAPALGVDPDVWFGQVERIALEDVGIQPVQYVGNINKIAIAISLLIEEGEIEQAEIERIEREYGG
jgi:membrane-bound lytic murein transglycosylase MltF